MKKSLTPKQKKVYSAIINSIETKGYVPSIEELCEMVGLSSVSSIHHHLKGLEDKGYIEREKGKSRSIRILNDDSPKDIYDDQVVAVPIIGEIAAGEPIFAYEDYTDSVLLARDLISTDEAFILKVRGKSMIEDLIDDGDMVVVKKQNTASNGDIVVALLPDNEATLKRFYKEKDRIRLQPANSSMNPISRICC